ACYADLRDLLSFPTRRSSDLKQGTHVAGLFKVVACRLAKSGVDHFQQLCLHRHGGMITGRYPVLHQLQRTHHLVGMQAFSRQNGRYHSTRDDGEGDGATPDGPFHPSVSKRISIRRFTAANGSLASLGRRSAKPETSVIRRSSTPARTSM